MAGVKVDSAGLATFSEELGQDLARLETEVQELAGREFNLGSPKQLGDILFDELKRNLGYVNCIHHKPFYKKKGGKTALFLSLINLE